MFKAKKLTFLLLFFSVLACAPVFSQKKDDRKVSHAELVNFVNVFQKLQKTNKIAQQKMVQVVESTGLSMKRFNEIHTAYVDYNMSSDATKKEQEKHISAVKKIKRMQDRLKVKMDSIVKAGGLNKKEYRRIAIELRDNLELRKEYNKIIRSKREQKKKE